MFDKCLTFIADTYIHILQNNFFSSLFLRIHGQYSISFHGLKDYKIHSD